jgi:hypothetical protein
MNDDLKFEVGDTFHDDGYVSTTEKKSVASEYFGDHFNTSVTKSGVMVINVPKSEKILEVNAVDPSNMHSPEKEFILPRGSNFKVTKIDDTTSSNYKYIYTTLLPPSPKQLTKSDVQYEDTPKFVWGSGHLHKKVAKFNHNHDARGEFSSSDAPTVTRNRTAPHMLAVEHYSPVANLDMLDPRKAGTGRVGRERERKTRIDAVHVYDSKDAKLEQQFRHDYRYTGEIPRAAIYDIAKDPDGLIPKSGLYDATHLERAIKNHGYVGFRNSASQNPSIIKLFYSLKVKPASPRHYRGMRFGSPHSMSQRVVAVKSWILHKRFPISETDIYLAPL